MANELKQDLLNRTSDALNLYEIKDYSSETCTSIRNRGQIEDGIRQMLKDREDALRLAASKEALLKVNKDHPVLIRL